MKVLFMRFMVVLLLVCVAMPAGSREKKEEQPRFYRPDYEEVSLDIPGQDLLTDMTTAAADTYLIVWYDFEHMDWQGWTRVDNHRQLGTFFHVEDFAGLDGGSFGRLVPIEGTKSIWCGADGSNMDYSCSWAMAPGYGNGWSQSFRTEDFVHEGNLTVSFHIVCDTEEGYDFVYFEHSDDYFLSPFDIIETFDGVVDTVVTYELFARFAKSKLRFRFESDSAFSDSDGNHDTDGACIIDSITVADTTGVIDFEDFESYADGDTAAGFWYAYRGGSPDGSPYEHTYGTYSGLAQGLQDKYPCGSNLSTVVMFFEGSPYPSQQYPGLFDTPFCTGPGGIEDPCQDEMVVSPPIDLTRFTSGRDELQDAAIPPGDLPALGGVKLEYAVYSDNPLSNLVLRYKLMRNIENGCPGEWHGPGIWYPYEPTGWWTDFWYISNLATSDTIQVALGISDMCSAWYGTYGDCEYHTPAPWYDNVRIKRWDTSGPQWSVRAIDLFQDTFPVNRGIPGSMENFCRADMANDLAPGDEFGRIDPGDSVVVQVDAPSSGGLDTLATGEARVYLHCNVTFLGPDGKPDLFGPTLEGTYGSYVSDDGDWTVLICEPAATSAGNIAPDKYCVDLNDSLFTRGYMIEYYFKAYDLAGNTNTYPGSAETAGGKRFEFTCLPTLRRVPGALFVDDYHGRGTFEGTVETYWDLVFGDSWPCCIVPPYDSIPPDRYDVNGPSSGVSNGVGAYTIVSGPDYIFSEAYETVMFDSGDLNSVTICDGTEHSDKSNDANLLAAWMYSSDHKVGLLVMGDNVAFDLSTSASTTASILMNTCGVALESHSYFDLTGGHTGGGDMNPLVTGVPGSPFEGLEYYLSGGCPFIKDFDVLAATGPGLYGLQYPDYNSTQHYAGIYTDQINDRAHPMKTVWIGHSLMHMRDPEHSYFLVRKQLVMQVNEFFERYVWGVDAEIPAVTVMADNFPNPFNPVTRVKFALKEKGHVKLRVYDVSGRLVRILVDDIREAGAYEIMWDGTNDGGRATASGIYFCRMEATDYERTLKMVLLR